MLAFHTGFAIRVYVHVKRHRVAADRAVLDVVLVRTPGDIHWHDDFFATGVADIRWRLVFYGGVLSVSWPFHPAV